MSRWMPHLCADDVPSRGPPLHLLDLERRHYEDLHLARLCSSALSRAGPLRRRDGLLEQIILPLQHPPQQVHLCRTCCITIGHALPGQVCRTSRLDMHNLPVGPLQGHLGAVLQEQRECLVGTITPMTFMWVVLHLLAQGEACQNQLLWICSHLQDMKLTHVIGAGLV